MTEKYFNSNCFSKYANKLLLLFALSSAISIVASQIFLGVLIAYWILFLLLKTDNENAKIELREVYYFIIPLAFFFAVEIITSISGLSPLKSIMGVIKSSYYTLVPLAIFSSFTVSNMSVKDYLHRIESYVAALLIGQSIAGIHTIFAEGFNLDLPRLMPGPLTESGQLVLIVPLILVSVFAFFSQEVAEKEALEIKLFAKPISPVLYSAVLFIALLFLAWPGSLLFGVSESKALLFRFLVLMLIMLITYPIIKKGTAALKEKLLSDTRVFNVNIFPLIWFCLALLFAALLINLKRGPWLGVFVEILIVGYILSKRTVFAFVTVAFLIILTVSPARSRLISSEEHFNINGGRKTMWELGGELIQLYPLGLGYKNAEYMRHLDSTIPETHRHMHNNLLNITVESGWLGLAAYC
ncbi:MAG: O-antigen ligase family protein, partial [Proteobacteria bacterium]|nr:O-antigen ligase family protein [Pseudomonadota bacterium]